MQNDTIMANSIEDIVENIINKYSLNNIVLDDEENNRTIKQETVQKPNLFYDRNSY